jgi:hypothetical protein
MKGVIIHLIKFKIDIGCMYKKLPYGWTRNKMNALNKYQDNCNNAR